MATKPWLKPWNMTMIVVSPYVQPKNQGFGHCEKLLEHVLHGNWCNASQIACDVGMFIASNLSDARYFLTTLKGCQKGNSTLLPSCRPLPVFTGSRWVCAPDLPHAQNTWPVSPTGGAREWKSQEAPIDWTSRGTKFHRHQPMFLEIRGESWSHHESLLETKNPQIRRDPWLKRHRLWYFMSHRIHGTGIFTYILP